MKRIIGWWYRRSVVRELQRAYAAHQSVNISGGLALLEISRNLVGKPTFGEPGDRNLQDVLVLHKARSVDDLITTLIDTADYITKRQDLSNVMYFSQEHSQVTVGQFMTSASGLPLKREAVRTKLLEAVERLYFALGHAISLDDENALYYRRRTKDLVEEVLSVTLLLLADSDQRAYYPKGVK